MNVGNQADYIKYRFQRAEESFEEANLLFEHKRWNATINRLYYTCFYAVIALLLKNDIRVQTHDGARLQFGLHFVKTGLFDIRFWKLYSKLFDFRQKGDYGDLYDFDAETISPLIEPVAEFLNEIRMHLLKS
jgi:uncharacterized protein (UPF0332 family)